MKQSNNIGERYILLLEDDKDDIELTKLALKQNNISATIKVKTDGKEALEFIDELRDKSDQLTKPTVILLDINMPEADGFKVLRKIKKTAAVKEIPVVMLSSSDEEQDINQSYKYGANSYIQKPANFKDFVFAVKHISKYWLDMNKPPVT